jgi:hypothetical protein
MPGIDVKSKNAKYIHVRQKEPFLFIDDSMKTIAICGVDSGIKAVMGKLKKEPDGSMKVQSMMFDKTKFTVKTATKWIRSHGYKIMNKAFANSFDMSEVDISIEDLLSQYNERVSNYIKTLRGENKD